MIETIKQKIGIIAFDINAKLSTCLKKWYSRKAIFNRAKQIEESPTKKWRIELFNKTALKNKKTPSRNLLIASPHSSQPVKPMALMKKISHSNEWDIKVYILTIDISDDIYNLIQNSWSAIFVFNFNVRQVPQFSI